MKRNVIQNVMFFENLGKIAANICITAMNTASCMSQERLGQAGDKLGQVFEKNMINIVFPSCYHVPIPVGVPSVGRS
jgi:hypothetical protein